MKNLLTGFLFALACFASPAFAQSCNDPSGFVKARGTINIGDLVTFGPDCQSVQDSGLVPFGATYNAKMLGAVGNGIVNDTTALQTCINLAQTAHTGCYVPGGSYKTTAPLVITSRIAFFGDGFQSSGQQCYTSPGCANLGLAALANSTTILPASNSNGINITSDDAIQIHDLQVAYVVQPAALSGITAISVGPSVVTHINSQTYIWNTMLAGADRGLYSLNCVHCSFHHNQFYNQVSFSAIIDGTPSNTNGNVGDSEFSNNTFVSGTGTTFTHIFVNAGGGWRIQNNKLDAAGGMTAANISHGILVSPQAVNASIEPLVITGNTIEGCDICIGYENPAAGVTATQGVISGNQIWASNNTLAGTKGVGIKIANGAQWVSGLTVTGNFINIDGGAGGVGLAIGNASASHINVDGNVFSASASGAQAWTLGTGLTDIKIDGDTNIFQGNVGVNDTTIRRTYSLALYSVTAFTTIATLTPSTTATFAAGLIRCDLGGNTATAGSGHRTSVWTFDVPNAATTAAVLGADVTAGAAPPNFRLNISGNSIQVQAQSSNGVNALSVGYMSCTYEIPAGTAALTWVLNN